MLSGRPEHWRAIRPALLALAAANLTAGLWIASRPFSASDLRQVTSWTDAWFHGVNPYVEAGASVDYPPWAIVLLSPLAFVPPAWRSPLWIALNVCLILLLAHRMARATREPARERLALMLLLASTAAAHTLMQFSVLSSTLAIAGGLAVSPIAGALAVGLALMKPHVGGVVLLWWALTRQWKKVAIALVVPAALAALFGLRVGVSVPTLMQQYVNALTAVHGAAEPIDGHTELRGWLVRLWPRQSVLLSVSAGVAIALLVPAAIGASRRRSWTTDDMLEGLALCGAVSLLAVRHLSYDFILLWPALVAWRTGPFAAGERRGRPVAFWLLAAVLVIGLASWARAAVGAGAPPSLLIFTETDRVIPLGVWLYLSRRALTGWKME